MALVGELDSVLEDESVATCFILLYSLFNESAVECIVRGFAPASCLK